MLIPLKKFQLSSRCLLQWKARSRQTDPDARSKPDTHGTGFTLVELLVAIAIIGILGGILIPVIGSVMENAKIIRSTTNLREIGTAVQLFQQDNDYRFPVHRSGSGELWIEQLWPYSNPNQEYIQMDVSSGPQALKGTIYYTPMVEDDNRARSFGYNYVVDFGVSDRLIGYRDAVDICLVADSTTSSSLSVNQINYRNKGKANILFADGHVELRSPEEVPESHHSTFWRGIDEN